MRRTARGAVRLTRVPAPHSCPGPGRAGWAEGWSRRCVGGGWSDRIRTVGRVARDRPSGRWVDRWIGRIPVLSVSGTLFEVSDATHIFTPAPARTSQFGCPGTVSSERTVQFHDLYSELHRSKRQVLLSSYSLVASRIGGRGERAEAFPSFLGRVGRDGRSGKGARRTRQPRVSVTRPSNSSFLAH